ncbi:hypothetical protein [Novosphingobium naphthalenivorans]|uniref:hypothetical protein n=1 Tax=Novosphingobium naphthalenivorans TaxID=273168 RepID=UPI00082DD4F6|nr:hypothetical protein [Novosphingobium naphthalenivorans]
MAEHEAGTPCPGCTAEKITAKMAANPLHDFYACRQCLEHGALFYANHNTKRVREDETHAAGGEGRLANGEAHGQG